MPSAQLVVDLPADPLATEQLGERLGERLRPGDAVALSGQLGAGKTTLVRGLARGLGVDDPDAVASPTYLLVVEHPGSVPLLHADAYLPDKLEAFLADGGLEYLFRDGAVAAVEWGDRIRRWLPARTLFVEFVDTSARGRRLVLHGTDPAHFAWLHDADGIGAPSLNPLAERAVEPPEPS